MYNTPNGALKALAPKSLSPMHCTALHYERAVADGSVLISRNLPIDMRVALMTV